jgi:predicted Zn-dependent protease
MKKILFFLSVALILIECSRVPLSNRRQFAVLPESDLQKEAKHEYDSFLRTQRVITGTPDAAMVDRVGAKLAASVTQVLKNMNQSDRISGFQWEYHLVDSKEVNAWCMPGGKIVVYSGILPYTKDETGLATVLGHEISHAVAHHGNERMSQAMAAQLGGEALDVALSEKPQQTRQIFQEAYGVTTNLGVLLPFSRQQESEADHLGLIFMAAAGYDPHKALDFWQRMTTLAQQGAPPPFLSDHPSDQQRISDIQKEIPQAMNYYKP